MKTISFKKASSIPCPVSAKHGPMEYILPAENRYDTEVQSLACRKCGTRVTLWNVVVSGLEREWQKINRERFKVRRSADARNDG